MNTVKTITATIAISTSLSAAVKLDGVTSNDGAQVPMGYRLCGLELPSEWTAANLTFQVSTDGVTYRNLYDRFGTEVVVSAAASIAIPLEPELFYCWTYIKVRSGTSGTPVNQAAARTVGLVLRSV